MVPKLGFGGTPKYGTWQECGRRAGVCPLMYAARKAELLKALRIGLELPFKFAWIRTSLPDPTEFEPKS